MTDKRTAVDLYMEAAWNRDWFEPDHGFDAAVDSAFRVYVMAPTEIGKKMALENLRQLVDTGSVFSTPEKVTGTGLPDYLREYDTVVPMVTCRDLHRAMSGKPPLSPTRRRIGKLAGLFGWFIIMWALGFAVLMGLGWGTAVTANPAFADVYPIGTTACWVALVSGVIAFTIAMVTSGKEDL